MDEQHIIFAWALFAVLFSTPAMVGYYIYTKHKEKIELIKKGDYAFQTNYLENVKYSSLSKGILLVSLALGFAIGFVITQRASGPEAAALYLIPVLACSGIGLLVYYFILNARLRKDA